MPITSPPNRKGANHELHIEHIYKPDSLSYYAPNGKISVLYTNVILNMK